MSETTIEVNQEFEYPPEVKLAYVNVSVEGGTPIRVLWKQGMNAQGALEAAYNQVKNSSKFSFATQFYGTYQTPPSGPLGYMVIMMNGVYDLPGQGQYWAFYLNGNYASKGIDYTMMKPNDSIDFKNETYDAKTHKDTLVEFKHFHYMALKNK